MASRSTGIILVDPQEVLRLGVRSLVSGEEWQVIGEADDGRDGLHLVDLHRPELVILEHPLPSLNGLDLTKAILMAHPKSRVILFTSRITDSIIGEYIRVGVAGIVLKTDDFEEMLKAIRKALRGKRHYSPRISESMVGKILNTQEQDSSALTARERQVVQLISEGQLNKQAAHTLGVSCKTIETHRASAMQKLNLASTAQLVRYAVRNHIVIA